MKINIALVGPFSGPRAVYGKMLARICDSLTIDPQVRWTIYDDQADPQQALICAQEIVTTDTPIVVGHLNSLCAEIAAPLYAHKGIPLILPAATKRYLTHHHNVFRFCPNDDLNLNEMLKLFARCNINSIAVYNDGSSYGEYLYHQLSDRVQCLNSISLSTDIGDRIEYILALGAHHGIAAFINSLSRVSIPLSIYCCDDASIEDFAEMISASPHHVYVIGPEGGYAKCSELAMKKCIQCIKCTGGIDTLGWFINEGSFDRHNELIGVSCVVNALK